MSRVRACAVALAGLAAIGAAKPPPPPAYELSPVIEGGQLKALRVTLKLTAGRDGKVQLELPDESAGVTDLWRYLRDFKVEGASAVATPKPAERLIEAKPGAPITVTYRVVSAFDHEPPVSELETNKPLIRPSRFWAYGETLFAYPTNAKTATFRWTGAPEGFGFASSFERPAG
jgi:predicted metalloprotease with PDZ domain